MKLQIKDSSMDQIQNFVNEYLRTKHFYKNSFEKSQSELLEKEEEAKEAKPQSKFKKDLAFSFKSGRRTEHKPGFSYNLAYIKCETSKQLDINCENDL